MVYRPCLFVCVAVLLLKLAAVTTQTGKQVKERVFTRFSCIGRVSGYYADTETGCQVYHMCDGLGRQFSYKCPNMTLFQQRMLICDHWYMVNCSMSEQNYDANLLIGQRDKPFVSDEEMRLRTPRPDILSVPPYNPYFDLVKTSGTQGGAHSSNSIVGFDDVISDVDNDLETARASYRPPTAWSSGTKRKYGSKIEPSTTDSPSANEATSQEPRDILPVSNNTQTFAPNVTPPSLELIPPIKPTTEPDSEDNHNNDAGKPKQDPVFQFIKRFDPTSPDVQTAMTQSEIIDINGQLPSGPLNSEEERTPRKLKNFGNNVNTFKSDNDKTFIEGTKFDNVNVKASKPESDGDNKSNNNGIPEPERELVPPKTEFGEIPSTTVGPPIYYDWKWAVPAFGLTPPKESAKANSTDDVGITKFAESPFRKVTRPEPKTTTPEPSNVEYNISSYFVPDYVFPLDKEHPGYDNEDAQTSFQVKVANSGSKNFGENPNCPQCHPAYLTPGTCEPCIVKR